MNSKEKIRTSIRKIRRAMTESEVRARSAKIVVRLEAYLNRENYKSFHCYEPIPRLHEVNIWPFVRSLEREQVALYTSRRVNGEWRVVPLNDHDQGKTSHFDCIIVPMLGFDYELNRLGQGSGYYDRLLERQPKAFKIGVCFESGKFDKLPHEQHDIPLDVVVTEDNIYRP